MKVYFTPGPTQLHHAYEFHLRNALKSQLGSISHRGAEFQALYQQTENVLRELLAVPEDFTVFFLSSATDIWERIFQNLVSESSHHFVNGAFSKRFWEFGQQLGKNSTSTVAKGSAEFADLSVPENAELIAITQNETSIGYAFDPEKLKSLRANNPEKLIALDIVSSAVGVPIDFDSIDIAYFSVQKCFGMPAGLGVWMLNNSAIEKGLKLAESGNATGTYRSLPSLLKYASRSQTPETPNVIAIYVLGMIAQEMINRGPRLIQNEIVYKNTILYQALEQHGWLQPYIGNKTNRSKTVIVADCGQRQQELLNYFEKMKFVIGKGYGEHKADHIRIANFPAHSKEHIEMICDHLEKIV